MTADELCRRFSMDAHIEKGSFAERHYPHDGAGRPASGSILYYVAPGERTQFHRIDCDEYWIYNLGAPLELWIVDTDGKTRKRMLGVEADCEPFVYLPKGVVFASRQSERAADGTFVTCITVPRFRYEGFTMLSEEEMREKYPETAAFYT